MRIFFLGVGAAINSTAFKSCYLIDGHWLIDVSPEAATILVRHRMPLTALSDIFVTHLHGDHILGLPLLLTEFLINEYKGDRLRIYGPPGLERVTRELLAISYPEVSPDKFIAKSKALFEEFTPGVTVKRNELSLEAIPVIHGLIRSFGFYVQGKDASLFISGDTILCPEVEANVRRADCSIIDVTTETERLPTHMNLDDALLLRNKLSKGQNIFASHRTFSSDSEIAQIIFPKDFETYELQSTCTPLLVKAP